jgi:hypothetical protein
MRIPLFFTFKKVILMRKAGFITTARWTISFMGARLAVDQSHGVIGCRWVLRPFLM